MIWLSGFFLVTNGALGLFLLTHVRPYPRLHELDISAGLINLIASLLNAVSLWRKCIGRRIAA
jgi:hypothetical protein